MVKEVIQAVGFKRRRFWGILILLWLFYGLTLSNLSYLSPTIDEQGFITRGLGYLRSENRYMRVGHPLGLNALNAILLWPDEGVDLPIDDPAWKTTDFHRPSELFLWEIGNDVAHVMFLARLPSIWLGLLMVALVGRWVWELTHRELAVLLATGMVALDPNMLAHGRLATTDFGLTFFAFLAGYALWRFWKRPGWHRALFAGIAFGLLQNTKFTAGLFVPLFALLIAFGLLLVWRRDDKFPWHILPLLIVAYFIVPWLTLWAAYGFQIGTLPQDLPILPQLGGRTLPLSHYLEQLLDIGGRLQKSTPAFLLGNYSDSGWWYYFPVAFLLKTPLPTLLLLVGAILLRVRAYVTRHTALAQMDGFDKGSSIWPEMLFNDAALLIPALGYFAIALTSDINLGYRHILPILPFLVVFTAVSLSSTPFTQRRLHIPIPLTALVLIWLFGVALWIHPHYLAYFNLLAGGPNGGWRYLVDSNLDWGQDLGGLKVWMNENEVDHVWLSFFGEGRPEYYDLDYSGLDSWPPRLMDPAARPFFPDEPAPGFYAISATMLQGVNLDNHDLFAWFREREPLDKIGYSIFLYQVDPLGSPVDLALGGVQLDQIEPEDFSLLGTNRVVPHWFDPVQSVLLPPLETRWLALHRDVLLNENLITMLPMGQKVTETAVYTLYQLPAGTATEPKFFTNFTDGIGTIALADETTTGQIMAIPGQTIQWVTVWHKEAAPHPIKIFLHLTDSNDTVVAQWDGLGAAWQGWRAGDVLWQWHDLVLPSDLLNGRYQLWVGLYDPDTGVRWQTLDGDRYLLGSIQVQP